MTSENMPTLTGKQKRFLRGLGHAMRPLVTVGKQGITPALIKETAACLLAHELIKVKILESATLDGPTCADTLSQETGAAVAQQVGRTFLLFRPHPKAPQIKFTT